MGNESHLYDRIDIFYFVFISSTFNVFIDSILHICIFRV